MQKLVIMKGAIWNIRGLNKDGRIKCLSDFINTNNLDFVGIQETKKVDFPINLLTLLIGEWSGFTFLLRGQLEVF
jgi:exonuclease III